MSCDRCGTRYAKKTIGSRKVYNVIDRSEAVCSGLMLFWGSYSQVNDQKYDIVRDNLAFGSMGVYWRGTMTGITTAAKARRLILTHSKTPSSASAGDRVKVSSGQMLR